ncbi:MAG: transglutaminase family protein [Actinobacteria bacterium]|nr:transglutaminase family protein [Actinomycetota bacterium]
MRYRIQHLTSYSYDSPVFESFNEVRLQPLVCATQSVLDFDLRIEPPATVIAFRDYYGNSVHDFGVAYLHDRLVIEATSDVVTHAAADELLVAEVESETDASPALETLAGDGELQDEFSEFLGPSSYIVLGNESKAMARKLLAAETSPSALRFLDLAAEAVRTRLTYKVGSTTVHSSVAEVLAGGAGVCQDFAHVLISLCRHVGLPARYVSGYLGGVAEAAASHAWIEAYVPPYGWLGIDATLGTHCTGQHVKIGVGRDYADVTVLRGTYQGGSLAELDVAVTCETVGGVDRVSQLGNDEEEPQGRLIAIQNLGAMRRFQQGAVLTQAMGGMRQTLSDDLPLPPPRAQTRGEDGTPSQQPHQQQQGPCT